MENVKSEGEKLVCKGVNWKEEKIGIF